MAPGGWNITPRRLKTRPFPYEIDTILAKTSPWQFHRLAFEPFACWEVGIVWDLIPGLICWPFYGPKKVKYYPTKTQKKSVFKENWYKIWLKRHLGSPVDLLLSLLHMKLWELFEIWCQGSFVGLSMAPTRSNIALWILKKVNFQGKLTRNLVKTSPPRLLWRLTFETFAHAVERIGQDLIQSGLLVAFWGTLWGQSRCCGDPKHVLLWQNQ